MRVQAIEKIDLFLEGKFSAWLAFGPTDLASTFRTALAHLTVRAGPLSLVFIFMTLHDGPVYVKSIFLLVSITLNFMNGRAVR
jgi:hypothetical protein